jgi:DNA-binding response OmpR family regulator
MKDKDLSPDGLLAAARRSDPPRILVVDDDPTSLALLGEILDPRDYTVTFTTQGLEALTLAREGVDLVLLDYHLPDLDGLEVCRRLKADRVTAAIPVIFVTADQDTEVEARGLEAGAVDFVTKPYPVEVLRARVNTHISHRTCPGGSAPESPAGCSRPTWHWRTWPVPTS